ncbi:hypothetical protein AURDEDRAFT_115407 [Auricularia subglabra TFB-10046 SS5]|nr:hypothetical protein AURDEDRAFT_115407 [Auricularia subglabra TFB-10046 SS5]
MSKAKQDDIIPDVSNLTHACGGCKYTPTEGETFKLCGRCKMTQYCGAECQRAHWIVHKSVCASRVKTFEALRAMEEAANKEGKPFYSWQVLHKWYCRNSKVIEFTALHALHVVRGPRLSLSRTHAATFGLEIDETRPTDPAAIRYNMCVPVALVELKNHTDYEGFKMVADNGGLVLSFVDMKKEIFHFERTMSTSMAEEYTSGRRAPVEDWRVHATARLNGHLPPKAE